MTFRHFQCFIYKNTKSLYEIEDSWDGFRWITADENNNNVIAFERFDKEGNCLVAIVNFSGNDYMGYRLGVSEGEYKLILNSDQKSFAGRGVITKSVYKTTKNCAHGKENSIKINLPRFTGLYFIKK